MSAVGLLAAAVATVVVVDVNRCFLLVWRHADHSEDRLMLAAFALLFNGLVVVGVIACLGAGL